MLRGSLGWKEVAVLEPLYEVVSPLGQQGCAQPDAKQSTGIVLPAKPLGDLNGKKIGLVWTVFTNGNVLLEALRDLLAGRYRGLQFVELAPGRNLHWGDYPDKSIGAWAREHEIDAAIVTAAC